MDTERPFYSEYGWAYELLIDRPVRQECAAIAAWFRDRGIFTGSTLLDAGCGTGRYAAELNRRGYVVRGVDGSPALLTEAKRLLSDTSPSLSFAQGDIATLSGSTYDGMLCRGVLNDFVDDAARRSILTTFANSLRSGGALVFDVREWHATVTRKSREPLFRKRVATDHGMLTFTSITVLDHQKRQLLIDERHVLGEDRSERVADYTFVMQCWTREEVAAWLRDAGFDSIAWFGAYDPEIPVGATDRLVVIAQRG